MCVQAALVIRGFGIRGFGIRGFDYSRMQKPRIARENCYFEPKLGLFKPKMTVLLFAV
jgi:hypothetical protein